MVISYINQTSPSQSQIWLPFADHMDYNQLLDICKLEMVLLHLHIQM